MPTGRVSVLGMVFARSMIGSPEESTSTFAVGLTGKRTNPPPTSAEYESRKLPLADRSMYQIARKKPAAAMVVGAPLM